MEVEKAIKDAWSRWDDPHTDYDFEDYVSITNKMVDIKRVGWPENYAVYNGVAVSHTHSFSAPPSKPSLEDAVPVLLRAMNQLRQRVEHLESELALTLMERDAVREDLERLAVGFEYMGDYFARIIEGSKAE